MKVAYEVVGARRLKLAAHFQKHGFANIRSVCGIFGISEATARRDLAALARDHKIKRTYGGALAEYEVRFTSFKQRKSKAWEHKKAIAQEAVRFCFDGETYFLDAGSTTFALAQALAKREFAQLTVVTSNLSIAELLSSVPYIELFLIGGRYLARQAAFLGDHALAALERWKFDAVFLGAEGMNRHGLWNTEAEIVTFQRAALARARQGFFLVDAEKWGRQTDYPILEWDKVPNLITNFPWSKFKSEGVNFKVARYHKVKRTTNLSHP